MSCSFVVLTGARDTGTTANALLGSGVEPAGEVEVVMPVPWLVPVEVL